MEGRQQDYAQSGLPSPYSAYNHAGSEASSADHTSASAQYQPNVKFDPDSSRSGSFQEYIPQQPRSYPDQQRYQQPNAHPGHAAMAQASPSTFASHGAYSYGNAPRSPLDSNASPAIDPSISASSPTYPPHQQYSPYAPQDHMQYGAQSGQPMAYAPRPEWAGHYGPPPMYGHVPAAAGGAGPGMVAGQQRPPPVYYGGYPTQDPGHADPARQGGHPLSTVYSFVPIPGAQQHKRPRRRYEEIERMYKCGWNGCEKAYGTLNHLNAHVTMQSHGIKRTPEEFKEIRKEWKAKKKEEDAQRKAEDERHRQEAVQRGQPPDGTPTQPSAQYPPQHMMQPQMGGPQLPPIGYAPGAGQSAPQYAGQPPVDGAQQYAPPGQMYSGGGYPQSPYAQGGQMYQQHAEPQQSQSYQQQ
ncbi:hypothetical protein MBLNU457_5806t1 [Dothideomycetes sp. NU457]